MNSFQLCPINKIFGFSRKRVFKVFFFNGLFLFMVLIVGFRVGKLGEIYSAIRDAIKSDGFILVDVVVDPKLLLLPNFYQSCVP
ncbi:MAG: hypothetical protein Lokiarch_42420 [Candidatus Lokiarchaeum sp. GC14_75]|nr:MAG: hypothetical protein Lokiarch_42420 [Candidatus Lokiarchaeum sp. GC14_75]